MSMMCVQDAFHITCQSQSLECPTAAATVVGSLPETDVSPPLSSFDEWDSAAKQHSASPADHLSGQDMLLSMSLEDLQSHQQQCPFISRVSHYVDRRHMPLRQEGCNESQPTLRVLQQWDKLTLLNGILYRVIKDPLTKQKRFQFVVPQSLKARAFAVVHDHAGHQSHSQTLTQASKRFLRMIWRGMSTVVLGAATDVSLVRPLSPLLKPNWKALRH